MNLASMATTIVNKLNMVFLDLVSLTKAIHKNLGIEDSSATRLFSKLTARSQLKEDIVIVGQAVRLPGDINRRHHDPGSRSKMGP